MEKNAREKIRFNTLSSVSVTDRECPEIFPPHWHNAAEFTVAVKDGCRYRVGNTLFELNTGDVLLVWPHQIHETVKIPPEGAVFIQFSSTILENNLDLISLSKFLYSYHYIPAETMPELAGKISQKIFEVQKLYNSSVILAETKCKQCIYDILLTVGEHVVSKASEESSTERISGAGRRYIHAACSYISENSSDNISQADVAKQVGLSTFYFSRLFKQYMHISFPAYLSNIRVKSAASLLLDDNLSITECAFRSGFQSTTAFNRVFHEITGYSPREYRKMYI